VGADGGIRVYDMRQFKENFGPVETEKFKKVITDSQCYFHEMKLSDIEPIPVLTVYKGDNIYEEPLFTKIEWGITLDEWDNKNLDKHNMPIELLTHMVQFLNNGCLIGDWEVWT
jgi:hypothetical protein